MSRTEHGWLIKSAQVHRILSQEAWLLNLVKLQQAKIHRDQRWYLSQVLQLSAPSQGELEENSLNPLPLMSKGEKWKTYCHQCQRGRLLEIWLQQRWRTQMIKVVIDVNRLFLKNRCWNTLQYKCKLPQHKCELLQHKCKHRCWKTVLKQRWNTEANADG